MRRIPPGRQRLPRQFVEQNQRGRIILAGLSVFGEQGYAVATVKGLTGKASLSRATFYKYFEDKDACFRAVHQEVLAWLEREARDAAADAEDWPSGVRAVCRRLLALLAEDPRLARICAVEWWLAGAGAHAHHEEAVAKLAAALRRGRAERTWGEGMPEALELFVLAGAVSVVANSIVYGREPGVEALARELPELILVNYLGPE